jgi:TrmH family RNA methyltransferase
MISKNQIKFIRSLQLKKHRDTHNCFVVEGEKIVDEIIKSDFSIYQIFATKGWLLSNPNIVAEQTYKISEKELSRISQQNTPNKVVAIVSKPTLDLSITALTKGLTLILDEIKDPGNLGTIIRVCDWFGVENIICSNNSVDVYNPKVLQATMGSLARVKVHYTDIENVINQLPNDFPIYGACIDGKNISDIIIEKEALLIMGNESFGISDKVSLLIKKRIEIPRKREGAESLNIAIATSILLHEFRR